MEREEKRISATTVPNLERTTVVKGPLWGEVSFACRNCTKHCGRSTGRKLGRGEVWQDNTLTAAQLKTLVDDNAGTGGGGASFVSTENK